MKTVYLDNNSYAELHVNGEALHQVRFLKKARALAVESSIFNLLEFAAKGRIRQGSPYAKLVEMVWALVRKDRVFCLLTDAVRREGVEALTAEDCTSVWYRKGETEYERWRNFWRVLPKGTAPTALGQAARAEKEEYERRFEPAREATRREMKRIGHDPDEPDYPLSRVIGETTAKRGVEFAASVACAGFPGLKGLVPLAQAMVRDKLHAIRTYVKVDIGLAAVKEAAHNKDIINDLDIKLRGVHDGSEHYDIRHAVCGRYADVFVTDDSCLRAIVNCIFEYNYRGAPYRALSPKEFFATLEDGM